MWAAASELAAFDLVKRQFGTVNGSPATAYDALIGQTVKFRSLTTDAYLFAGRSTKTTPITLAAIGILNGTGGSSRTYFMNSSAAGGMMLVNQSSGSFQLVARNVAVWTPAISVSTATPYLLVGTASPDGNANCMLKNLKTGAVSIANAGAFNAAPGNGNGTFSLGNADTLANSCDADLAAVLASNVYLSLGELQQWARDPWGPWRIPEFDAALLNFVVPASTGVAQSFVSVM
jgi:hypothetical protein